MKYEQLREKVQNWKKYPECVNVERAPLINQGFPGNFNLSFTEDDLLKEYGGYLGFDHDYIFSKIQTCIRFNDFSLLNTPDSWKYLGVFEMADVPGIVSLSHNSNHEKLHKLQTLEIVNFLEDSGISKKNIYASYNVGGILNEITNGKYCFNFQVPEDEVSKSALLGAGIPEENLIPDKTRDTFLSLFVQRPSPWGYRNEVYVDIGGKKLLDVATIEYFKWKPIFNGEESAKNIIGLEENENAHVIPIVGLERLCMAINKLDEIQGIGYLNEFYNSFKKLKGNENILAGESLRALHRIYSDIANYNCQPSRHHTKKIRKLLQNISCLNNREISKLLNVHTEMQPWHEDLQDGVKPTIERINQYRDSFLF